MSNEESKKLTWRQRTMLRILLLVAKWLSEDAWLKTEIDHIDNHIGCHSEI